MNPYDILGVAKHSGRSEIRRAYQRAARKAHPDREGGDHATMAIINSAYALLSDPVRRERFDQTGESDMPPPREMKAREMLLQAMSAFLDSGRDNVDPIKLIRSSVANHKREVEGMLDKSRRALVRTETQQKKIKDKGLFEGLFEQRFQNIRKDIAMHEEQLAVIEVAFGLLDDVAWLGEETQPNRAVFGGGWFTTTA